MKVINVALVGYGYWGRKLLVAVRTDPRFAVSVIVTRTPGLIEKDRPLLPVITDLNAVLGESSIDAIIVATPAQSHFEIGRNVLRAGKHLFMEKPLAETGWQAAELCRIARMRKRIVFVDYTFSMLPVISELRKVFSSGELGTVNFISMAMTQFGRFNGIDAYKLLGSHMLAVLDRAYPIALLNFECQDILVRNGVTETGVIVFKSRVPANIEGATPTVTGAIHVSLNDTMKRRQMTINCSEATIRCDMREKGGTLNINYHCSPDMVKERTRFEWVEKRAFNDVTGLQNAFSTFYDILHDLRSDNCKSAAIVSELLDCMPHR
jgi:predicted dehydrogenase